MITPPERPLEGGRLPDQSRPPGAPAPDARSAIEALAAAGARPARLSYLVQTIASQAGRVFRGSAFVALTAADGGLVVRRGEGVLGDCEGEALPVEGSLAGAAASAVRPRLSASLSDDASRPAESTWAAGPALAFPLTAESQAEGAVVVVRARGEAPFTTADADAAALIGAVAGAFLASSRRFAEVRRRHAGGAPAPGGEGPDAGGTLPMASVARALRHEINNSVGVIDAALQLLSREAAPMERANHYELINTGADRLRGLVSRLTRLEGDGDATAYVRDDGALGVR